MKILVADDDPISRRLIQSCLTEAGYDVSVAVDGAEALEKISRSDSPRVLVLDRTMPHVDGVDVCRAIRKKAMEPDVYIILLTGKGEREEIVEGFEAGADDYITKPFSPRELVARIRSVLRGLGQVPAAGEVLRLGELEIDASSMTVQVQGRNVLTTVREFRLLEYLASHRGRVLTRDQLLDAVWKETPFVTPRSIDVYIRRLREKIELDPRHPQYLKTLRGIGYRFEVPK